MRFTAQSTTGEAKKRHYRDRTEKPLLRISRRLPKAGGLVLDGPMNVEVFRKAEAMYDYLTSELKDKGAESESS